MISHYCSAKKTAKRRSFEYQSVKLGCNRLEKRRKQVSSWVSGGCEVSYVSKKEKPRTRAVRLVTESTKRTSDCADKRHAVVLFFRPGAEGLVETKQFFQHMHVLSFALIAERARNEQFSDVQITSEAVTIAPVSSSMQLMATTRSQPYDEDTS